MFNLIKELKNHICLNELEEQNKEDTLTFLKANKNAFKRENLSGHITASGYLFNQDLSKVLLTKHKKLGIWLQLGGHSDGDKNSLRVALKEAHEESGIEKKFIKPLSKKIADIDIQKIAYYAKGNIPEHLHYDVRFFLTTTKETFKISDESDALKWFSFQEFETLSKGNAEAERIVVKWKKLLNNQ